MPSLLAFLRVGGRQLRADPGGSAVIVSGIAVAVACACAIAQVVADAVLPDPALVAPDRLVRLEFAGGDGVATGRGAARVRPDPWRYPQLGGVWSLLAQRGKAGRRSPASAPLQRSIGVKPCLGLASEERHDTSGWRTCG